MEDRQNSLQAEIVIEVIARIAYGPKLLLKSIATNKIIARSTVDLCCVEGTANTVIYQTNPSYDYCRFLRLVYGETIRIVNVKRFT